MDRKEYKTLKDFIGAPIRAIYDHKGFYYVKPEKSVKSAMWRIDKKTGNVEYFDGLALAVLLWEDGVWTDEYPDDTELKEEFKQFLLSFDKKE